MSLPLTQFQNKLTESRSKESIRDSLVKKYQSFGYVIKPGDIFYKTTINEEPVWGLKVGQYTHSCSIDTTDFIVLFFVDRFPFFVGISTLWLIDSITI